MPLLVLLPLLPLLLVNAPLVMEAVRASCRLFVYSVMPGLFPYLTLVLMVTTRLPERRPAWLVLLLGWCGGSPTGARLLRVCQGMDAAELRRLAVTCATMSPMFLLGTVPSWLKNSQCAPILLASVLLGGWLTGKLANLFVQKNVQPHTRIIVEETHVMTFGEAVEASAKTMLMVCGMMAMLRTAAALCEHYLSSQPGLCLVLRTLLEVTSGTEQLAALLLPLAWRTALIAGATGFGGMAIILQNRAAMPKGLLSLGRQITLQAVHGAVSFLLALALTVMAGI